MIINQLEKVARFVELLPVLAACQYILLFTSITVLLIGE